jgi:hypothetical protein
MEKRENITPKIDTDFESWVAAGKRKKRDYAARCAWIDELLQVSKSTDKKDLDQILNDEIEWASREVRDLEIKFEHGAFSEFWQGPSPEELAELSSINRFIAHCRSALESNIEITGPIICIVHAFWAEQDVRKHIDVKQEKYIMEDDWKYQKSFKQLAKTYNEEFKWLKFIDFLKPGSDPKEWPTTSSINKLMKNMESAIQLLQTRSKAAVIFANERLSLVKDFARDHDLK